jgi:hypothetical protein
MGYNDDFRTEFTNNLNEVGDILTENGYDILAYTGNLSLGSGVKAAGHGDTPEQALDQTLADIDEDEFYEVFIPGNLIKDVYEGRDPGLDEVLYGNLVGMVEVEEPAVTWSEKEGDLVEADPSADPINDDSVRRAFGLKVEYHPSLSGNGHWELGSMDTSHPFTKDDARTEVEEIAQVFEENDIDYEIGVID